jgi:glycosyltransferase involved in cell wall biosynthesis
MRLFGRTQARQNWHESKVRGVNLLGHFRYISGLQAETEQTAVALGSAGYALARRDLPITDLCDPLGGARSVDLEVYPVSLLKLGAQEKVDDAYRRAGLFPRSGVYRIASWYWELDTFPAETVQHADLIDEVWSPTVFCAAAVRRVMTDRPVLVMHPPLRDPKPAAIERSRFGLPDTRFLFLFAFDMASVMERKNPLGLIQAYRLAFRPNDRVHLAIKVTRGERSPEDFARLRAAAGGGVTIIDELLPRAEALGLIDACDCYVSLHRSEGLGLSMAEAMLLGKPTIATAYSGNLDFMTERNSWLVNARQVELERDYVPYPRGAVWAEPDLHHAAELLRGVYEHPEEARAIGEQGRIDVRQRFGPASAGRRMAERLKEIQDQLTHNTLTRRPPWTANAS